MFGTAVIVFREVFEASLIIGIVAASTHDVLHRNRWMLAGLVMGLIGCGFVAASTELIASFASGVGQELFNAVILGVAVLMLAWHNIWMSVHGAQLAGHAQNIGKDIKAGNSANKAILIVVGLAVLREGSETTLFLYGVAASADPKIGSMFIGGLIGLLIAIVLGYVIYAGLLKIPMRLFFAATSTLITFLAAGMASQSAKFLIQADLLPSLGNRIWDSSGLISEQSIVGFLLHSLVGYDARPSGLQILFYVLVIFGIALGMGLSKKKISHLKLNNMKTAKGVLGAK